ncbi:hypothetical protein MKX03_022131 [Papaver bracteatum]|nr:hypothetical protein MKX03_022131 [Papaver bracteatum]
METDIDYDVGAIQRRGGAKEANHLTIYHIFQLVEDEFILLMSICIRLFLNEGLMLVVATICLILHKTKLCVPALASFKAYYEGDGFPGVFDFSLLSHVKETSGVPKQSQAQHEMLNMLKSRLFL